MAAIEVRLCPRERTTGTVVPRLREGCVSRVRDFVRCRITPMNRGTRLGWWFRCRNVVRSRIGAAPHAIGDAEGRSGTV